MSVNGTNGSARGTRGLMLAGPYDTTRPQLRISLEDRGIFHVRDQSDVRHEENDTLNDQYSFQGNRM